MIDSRREGSRDSFYYRVSKVTHMEDLPLPGYRLTWVRRSASGRLWTLEYNGKRVASVSSGVFGQRGGGTYDGRRFSLRRDGSHEVIFKGTNGQPLLRASGLRMPVTISVGEEERYGIWRSGTFDYVLSEKGRDIATIHIDKNAILTYKFASMTMLVPAAEVEDFWLIATVFMYVVKHNLPIDPDGFGFAGGAS
jgi:hypothetical protein